MRRGGRGENGEAHDMDDEHTPHSLINVNVMTTPPDSWQFPVRFRGYRTENSILQRFFGSKTIMGVIAADDARSALDRLLEMSMLFISTPDVACPIEHGTKLRC